MSTGSNDFHRLMWWLSRQALAADKVDGGVFALMADDERFYVSTDGGETWGQAAHSPPCAERNDCHVVGQLRAMPGRAGEMWASVGTDGLYRTVDLGASAWEKVPGLDEVRAFGFGAPLAEAGPAAIFVYGRGTGIPSAACGARTTTAPRGRASLGIPLGLYADVNSVSGDADIPGRVYVGFAGNGFAFGDDPNAG